MMMQSARIRFLRNYERYDLEIPYRWVWRKWSYASFGAAHEVSMCQG